MGKNCVNALHLCRVSADGGRTWTTQYLTLSEIEDERNQGNIVKV